MKCSDRVKINENINKLVCKTDYELLLDECHRRRMISYIMVENIKKLSPELQHAALLEKITHRGPLAFDILLDICKERFPEALRILNPSSNNGLMHGTYHRPIEDEPDEPYSIYTPASNSIDTDIEMVPYTHPIKEVNFTVVKSKNFIENSGKIPIYSMMQKERGVLLLINNINFKNSEDRKRIGAKKDRDNLIHLFRELNFVIFYYEDVTFEKLNLVIEQLKKSHYLKADCFVFCILSHGHHGVGMGKIELSDGAMHNLEDIVMQFNSKECPQLINKPKIFLVQVCRGDLKDQVVKLAIGNQLETDGVAKPTTWATYSDMLICYATVPGFVAYRDRVHGSWFIDELCKVWAANAHDTDVDTLMKMVGEEVCKKNSESGVLQTTANQTFGFHHLLYFNPGLWH